MWSVSGSLGGAGSWSYEPANPKSDDSNTFPATANPEDADIGPRQAKLDAQLAFLEPKTCAEMLRVLLCL